MRRLREGVLLAVLCAIVSPHAVASDRSPPAPPEAPLDTATQQPAAEPADKTPPSERRSGFTAGIAASLATGKVAGYPNEVQKLDDPESRASTGLGLGPSGMLWIGGALRDWFNFGIGTSLDSVEGNGRLATGFAVLFRVEAYPAYSLGGSWRDVSVFGNVGAGSVTIVDAKDTENVQAEGGSMSVVGLGAAFEPWRLWRFAAGPFVSYEHRWSLSMKSHLGLTGIRLVFYGGP